MCSEIDERTRDNPESAMLHHNELCQGYMTGMQQNPSALEVAQAYDAHQKRMAQQYPGAWPWPVSGASNPHDFAQEKFDSEAHRAFMRGLG